MKTKLILREIRRNELRGSFWCQSLLELWWWRAELQTGRAGKLPPSDSVPVKNQCGKQNPNPQILLMNLKFHPLCTPRADLPSTFLVENSPNRVICMCLVSHT